MEKKNKNCENKTRFTELEAADMIENDIRLHHDYLSGIYRKALRMAVKALRKQADKDKTDKQRNKNARYIDASVFDNLIIDPSSIAYQGNDKLIFIEGAEAILDMIRNTPPAF